ncbi:50S ribosomal protein L11 methyltransferase [Candidatus Nitrospira bockiana]
MKTTLPVHPERVNRNAPAREWIDVRITGQVDAGELMGLLEDPALSGAWQDQDAVHLYWPREHWNPDRLHGLKAALHRLTAGAADLPIAIETLADQDWNAVWARSVQPFRIGRRIVIRPSWAAASLHPGDVELILDPKQAFGTGHHATTQLLVEWLEAHVRGGERVLDVGTGSGILAMVALRLGAARAVGVDTDPVAVDCAHGYAVDNRFGPELTLRTGTDWGREYDLVLANLDRRTLLDLRASLAAVLTADGRLACSGVLEGDREEIVAAFAEVGLAASWLQARDGWLALSFRRPAATSPPVCP